MPAQTSSTETMTHAPLLLRPPDIRQLAVFRALRLGDMLCAVPALRALRHALPKARIALVGLPWAEQFVSRFHRYIDELIVFPGHPAFPEQPVQESRVPGFYHDMQARGFDLAIQMHGSGEISNPVVRQFGAKSVAGFRPAGSRDSASMDASAFLPFPESGPEPLRLLQLARHLGASALPEAAALEFPLEFPLMRADEEELRAVRLSPGMLPASYICIHPGASSRSKCWPPHLFAAVADALSREHGLPVVLTGSAAEKELTDEVAAQMRTEAINAAAPISIGAMAALISRSRLLISNDTGVSHIAAAFRLPSVVIFHTADMERWAPVDRALHRCIRDPQGKQAHAVLAHAHQLLAGAMR